MTNNKTSYKCEGCKNDVFRIIQEDELFDYNNTKLFKVICTQCGKEVENKVNSHTLMILDSTKDKIDNIQMSMKNMLNQFNELLKSKGELKETEDILKSIDYITSIQQSIISLQKDKLLSNVCNAAYIVMHNLPKNIEAKDYIMKPDGTSLLFSIPLIQIKPFKEIGNVDIIGYDENTISIKVVTDIDDVKMSRTFNVFEPLGVYEIISYIDMRVNYSQKKL